MKLLIPEAGALITRISLGIVLLGHSVYLKIFVFGLPGTAQYFESIGLPAMLAYAVFGIEAAAGIALILGYRVRLAAAAVVPILLGATWTHWENGWLFTNSGGGWEYPLVLATLALGQALSGGGPIGIRHRDRAASKLGTSEVAK